MVYITHLFLFSVMVCRHVSVDALVGCARQMGVDVPDQQAFAILLMGSLNLVGSGSASPEKIGWKVCHSAQNKGLYQSLR